MTWVPGFCRTLDVLWRSRNGGGSVGIRVRWLYSSKDTVHRSGVGQPFRCTDVGLVIGKVCPGSRETRHATPRVVCKEEAVSLCLTSAPQQKAVELWGRHQSINAQLGGYLKIFQGIVCCLDNCHVISQGTTFRDNGSCVRDRARDFPTAGEQRRAAFISRQGWRGSGTVCQRVDRYRRECFLEGS
jgi:hypothetical protein